MLPDSVTENYLDAMSTMDDDDGPAIPFHEQEAQLNREIAWDHRYM